jgi:hypothetical protein
MCYVFGGENSGIVTEIGSNGTDVAVGKPDAQSDDGINENDIRQGQIGDCYLLACLVVLAKNEKNFIRAHLSEDKQTKKYKIDFFTKDKKEEKIYFAVDDLFTHGISQAKLSGDYLTVANNKFIEVWPQVYEKAWSAILPIITAESQKYGNIESGVPTTPWRILAGRDSKTITITSSNIVPPSPDIVKIAPNNEEIWNTIKSQIANYYLVVGTKKDPTINSANYSDLDGYACPIGGHAYVIDSIKIDEGTVELLNPHGKDHVILPFSELSNVLNNIFLLYKQ